MRIEVWRAPLTAWVLLMAALATTTLYAMVPAAPLKATAALTVIACKVAIIAWIFMRLRRAEALLRFAAATGLLWLVALFVLGFSDYFSR